MAIAKNKKPYRRNTMKNSTTKNQTTSVKNAKAVVLSMLKKKASEEKIAKTLIQLFPKKYGKKNRGVERAIGRVHLIARLMKNGSL